MDLVVIMPMFVVAVLIGAASPGPAMALVIRRSAVRGLGAAVPLILGLEVGIYLWALAAGAGFAALVAASELAFWVLKVAGTVVLIWLGLRAWSVAWSMRGASDTADVVPAGRATQASPSASRAFAEGLLVQLANPKAAVLVLAFYPQVVPAGSPLLATAALLAVAQVVLETMFFLGVAALVARSGTWFRRSTVRRRLEAVSGTVLIALGLRVAVTSR